MSAPKPGFTVNTITPEQALAVLLWAKKELCGGSGVATLDQAILRVEDKFHLSQKPVPKAEALPKPPLTPRRVLVPASAPPLPKVQVPTIEEEPVEEVKEDPPTSHEDTAYYQT